jgi:hypothetical protein
LAAEFAQSGSRVTAELAAVVVLCDKKGREAALQRIEKGSAIVYLTQARAAAGRIEAVDGGPFDWNRALITRVTASQQRLRMGATILFGIARLLGVLLGWCLSRADFGRLRAGALAAASRAPSKNITGPRAQAKHPGS